MKRFYRFFDKLEDSVREHLSKVPIIYALVGAVAIVIFWRGIWDMADELEHINGPWSVIFEPFPSLLASVIVLLLTGLFVSFFIGDRIILSGLKHEKKVEEKTESEVRQEEAMLLSLHGKIDRLTKSLEELKSEIKK